MIPAHDVARVIVGVLLAAFAVALITDRARDIRRWWRGGARQMERARRLAAIDQAARTPVRRPQPPLGCLVVTPRAAVIPGDPDPAIGCQWCRPDDPRADNYGTSQPWWDKPCECAVPCAHPYCLAGEAA